MTGFESFSILLANMIFIKTNKYTESDIKEYYEQNPEGIASVPEIPEIYEMHHLILERVKKIEPKILLDAGCGKGFTGESIYPFTRDRYYGLDLSSTAIEIAKNKIPKGDFKCGSLTSLPYLNNFFDCVVCSEVLEHIPDYRRAIIEMARVLKVGGHLIVTTPNRINPDMIWRIFTKGKYTEQLYDSPVFYKNLIKEFKRQGLIVEESFSFFYLPLWGENMPKIIKKPLMKFQKLISAITGVPLGLYLFFNITKS